MVSEHRKRPLPLLGRDSFQTVAIFLFGGLGGNVSKVLDGPDAHTF